MFGHHLGDIIQQPFGVVDDAVLDGVFDAPNPLGLAGFVVQPHEAGAIEDLEVGDRVLGHDDEVGQHPGADHAEVRRLAGGTGQGFRRVHRRASNHLERVEAGFLEEFHFLNGREAIGVVDEAGIRTHRHPPAHVLVVVQQLEPDPVEIPPGHFVPGGPVVEVGPVIDPVRGVEIPERRQGVGLVPIGIPASHEVAARQIRRHRRIEGHVVGLEGIEQGPPFLAFRLDQTPLPGHLAEAPLLIGVVVALGVGLDGGVLVHRLEQAVEVGDGTESQFGGIGGVDLIDPGLSQVSDGAKPVLGRLIGDRAEDVGPIRGQFEAIDTAAFGVPNKGPGFVAGLEGRRKIPDAFGDFIDPHPGCRDFVLGAPGFLAQLPGVGPEGHAPAAGDAMGHPEFVGVLGLRGFGAVLDVEMEVDETRQHVHGADVDFLGGALGPFLGVDRDVRKADVDDLGNPVVFDHDVDGATHRTTGAINEVGAPENQFWPRPFTLGARRRRLGTGLGGQGGGYRERQREQDRMAGHGG